MKPSYKQQNNRQNQPAVDVSGVRPKLKTKGRRPEARRKGGRRRRPTVAERLPKPTEKAVFGFEGWSFINIYLKNYVYPKKR